MMGEELNASYISERGLLGDRVYALVDLASGKVVSAKNPKKWGTLFDFRATFTEPPSAGEPVPPVRIALPSGTLVTSKQADIEKILSEVLGREVRLVTTKVAEKPSLEEYWPDIEGLALREKVTDEPMPPYTFFDIAVIHLLTTHTINRLREVYPEGRFEVRRFRPNIVIEPTSTEKGFVENDWVGRTLAIGNEVRLKITGPCSRCIMTTLPQGDLPRDTGILRTATRYNGVSVGVYCSVLRGGTVRRGTQVRIG